MRKKILLTCGQTEDINRPIGALRQRVNEWAEEHALVIRMGNDQQGALLLISVPRPRQLSSLEFVGAGQGEVEDEAYRKVHRNQVQQMLQRSGRDVEQLLVQALRLQGVDRAHQQPPKAVIAERLQVLFAVGLVDLKATDGARVYRYIRYVLQQVI